MQRRARLLRTRWVVKTREPTIRPSAKARTDRSRRASRSRTLRRAYRIGQTITERVSQFAGTQVAPALGSGKAAGWYDDVVL